MERPEFVKIYLDPYRAATLVGTSLYFSGFSPTEEGIEGQKEGLKAELARNLASYLMQHMAFQIYDEDYGYRMVATMGVYPLTPEEQAAQKEYVDKWFKAETERRGLN